MHVELVEHVGALDRNAGGRDHRARLAAELAHPARQRRRVETFEHDVEGLHHVMPQIGQHAAERRRDAGKARHQRALQSDLPDQRADMQRAAAAERHRDEVRRIVAALDRDQPDRAGHARLRDAHDGRRRGVGVELERRADVGCDRAPRRLDVERFQLAAERTLRR